MWVEIWGSAKRDWVIFRSCKLVWMGGRQRGLLWEWGGVEVFGWIFWLNELSNLGRGRELLAEGQGELLRRKTGKQW